VERLIVTYKCRKANMHEVRRLGPYDLLKEIGDGSFGVVWLAEHRTLKRRAAVKVLSAQILRSDKAAEARLRFSREARLIRQFDHHNVIRIYDHGEENGQQYLAMEYIPGQSLSHIPINGLQTADAIAYFLQAAYGLQHMHERGVCHRDIAPNNLLVDGNGVLKITDFGLARMLRGATDLGSTGRSEPDGEGSLIQVRGNLLFAAPEQVEYFHAADHRSDIYSLACVFFYLLTGQPPFVGNAAEVLDAHKSGTLPLLRDHARDVSPELDAVFSKMMAKSPDDRYDSLDEVIQVIERDVARLDARHLTSVVVPSSDLACELVKTIHRLGLVNDVQYELQTVRYWLDEGSVIWEIEHAPIDDIGLKQTAEEASAMHEHFVAAPKELTESLEAWPRLLRLWDWVRVEMRDGCRSLCESIDSVAGTPTQEILADVRRRVSALRRIVRLAGDSLDEMLGGEITKLKGMASEMGGPSA
jgi:serine/threonine protein kinase